MKSWHPTPGFHGGVPQPSVSSYLLASRPTRTKRREPERLYWDLGPSGPRSAPEDDRETKDGGNREAHDGRRPGADAGRRPSLRAREGSAGPHGARQFRARTDRAPLRRQV